MDKTHLGEFIRARRESIRPEDVGLRPGPRRRVAGLRREELADLSDMSADYLARIERGEGPRPSVQMLAALSRGLRLTVDERDYLMALAGHPIPSRTGILGKEHVNPGLMRVLDAASGIPAQVMGSLGQTLAQNSTATALLGDQTRFAGPFRSATYRWFMRLEERALYPDDDHAHHGRVQVAQLREAVARMGPDSEAAWLLRELRSRSAEFERIWQRNHVGLRYSEQKRFLHPEVGAISLFCQVLLDPDQSQSLLLFTATPGTQDADTLRLLGVLGDQYIREA